VRVTCNEELDHLRLLAQIAGIGPVDVVVPQSEHVVIDGIRLHYLDWGTAGRTPIVFLHGGALNAHSWDAVCLALRGDFHCVALDQRGHGDSEWSPECDYSFDAHLRDLEGFVDLLAAAQFVLVGQSLGGINAIRYAARHGGRVAGLVVIDVGPHVQESAGTDRIVDFTLGSGEFESLDEALEHSLAFNPRRDPRLLRHSLYRHLRRLPDGRWAWKRDRRHLSRERFTNLVAQVQALAAEVEAIGCPALIVRGRDSDVFSDDDAAAFADLLHRGRWVTVERAGHNVQGDNPRGLLNVLQPFLTEVEPE
jgi:esterase